MLTDDNMTQSMIGRVCMANYWKKYVRVVTFYCIIILEIPVIM